MLRRGAVFEWSEWCNNAFNLLKSELVKMPRLQYPNPNKTFKLFTDASKYSNFSVLHQGEAPDKVNTVPKLVPVAFFLAHLVKLCQLWNTTQKECHTLYRSIQKFSFYLAGTKYILYCDHKPLAPFFIMGMSSPVLDGWALELQQFDIWFEPISGKKNMVAITISRLRALGLYQENGNTDLAKRDNNIVDNIVEEVHAIEWIPNFATSKMEKLNLVVLKEAQWQDTFCMKRLKAWDPKR